MAKKVPGNFKMVCKGNTPGKKNKVASCILKIKQDGSLVMNAVLASPLGDNLYDIAYLYCEGEFKIQYPQEITLIKDHKNFWGIWDMTSENYEAKSLTNLD